MYGACDFSLRDYDLWLDVQTRDVDRPLTLLAPYQPEAMTAYPVSPLVNNPANDSPPCHRLQVSRSGMGLRVVAWSE